VSDVEQAPEAAISRDMLKRVVWLGPALLVVFGLIWGLDGVLSTAYGLAIVCINFALAGALMTWAARISFAALGAAAFFGFLLRLALVLTAVVLVLDASWVALVPLCLTLVITHLGLLLWELRFVSLSLAFPGLRPTPVASPTVPSASTDPKESSVP
jgi:hypothetical protein